MYTNQPGLKTIVRAANAAKQAAEVAQQRRDNLAKQQRFLASIAPKA